MLKILKNQKGVTLSELAMTFVVLGILSFVAVVPYRMMQAEREATRLQAVLQNIETKVRVYKNDQGAFPLALDTNPSGQVCTTCFELVLNHVAQQNHWFKVSDTNYLFSAEPTGQSESDFRKPQDFVINYLSTDGIFVSVQNP